MNNKSCKPLTERGRFWLEHIRRWQATEDGPTHYCRTHKLSVSAFTWWRRQLFEQGRLDWERPIKKHSFVELPQQLQASQQNESCYEILCTNRRRLRIPVASFKDDDVVRLISIVESTC